MMKSILFSILLVAGFAIQIGKQPAPQRWITGSRMTQTEIVSGIAKNHLRYPRPAPGNVRSCIFYDHNLFHATYLNSKKENTGLVVNIVKVQTDSVNQAELTLSNWKYFTQTLNGTDTVFYGHIVSYTSSGQVL